MLTSGKVAVKSLGQILILLLCGLVVAGCESKISDPWKSVFADQPEVQAPVTSSADSQNPADTTDPEARTVIRNESEIYQGSSVFVNQAEPVAFDPNQETISLNFLDADLKVVVKAILGDWLGYNYVISPEVTGKITLNSSEPLSKQTVLDTFETLLNAEGISIVNRNEVFHLVRTNEALAQGQGILFAKSRFSAGLGFSTYVVQLRFAAAAEVQKILNSVIPNGRVVYTDVNRNLLVLAGTRQQIVAMQNVIDTFDADWLEGLSYAVFRPTYVDSATLAGELENILSQENSPISGLVRFVPIPRINVILAISQQPKFLVTLEQWVKRLDRAVEQTQRRVHIYFVQHGKASEFADLLNKLYGTKVGVLRSAVSKEDSEDEPETEDGAVISASIGEEDPQRSFNIIADEKNNALLVPATATEYNAILTTLEQIDIPPEQVLIEATIAEVSLTDELKYGVQWFFQEGNNSFTLSDAADGAVSSLFPGFSYTFLDGSTQVALNALDSITELKVISSPKLMVLNNETAKLQVGDQVPIVTQSSVSVDNLSTPIVNTVQFRDTGVILEVTPRISRDRKVVLEVAQEVSDVVETTTSGIDSPTIQQRKINSTVIIKDGQTVALGGLIRENNSESNSGIPILKEIPYLGNLFSNTSNTTRQTELIVFITPHIANDSEDTIALTDYLRQQMSTMRDAATKENWSD